MSIDCVSGYNTAKVKLTPIQFKGEPNVVFQEKPDTVELSTKQEKKSEGMSRGKKILLGIGGGGLAIYGALVTHRAVSRPALKEIQKDLSEIFKRNVSKEEIPNMLKKYKEIMNIEDKKQFCEKAFEQVKKDYGYSDINFPFKLDDSTSGALVGGWHSDGQGFIIFYKNLIQACGGKFDKLTRARIIDAFFHEFQHAKQTEYCIRTSPEKYLEALTNEKSANRNLIINIRLALQHDAILEMFAKKLNMTMEETKAKFIKDLDTIKTKGYKEFPEYVNMFNKEAESTQEKMNLYFGNMEKFKPGSKEYKQGEQYIENIKNYVHPIENINLYKEQIMEKEAFSAGKKSYSITERLKSIWNIFDNQKYNSDGIW